MIGKFWSVSVDFFLKDWRDPSGDDEGWISNVPPSGQAVMSPSRRYRVTRPPVWPEIGRRFKQICECHIKDAGVEPAWTSGMIARPILSDIYWAGADRHYNDWAEYAIPDSTAGGLHIFHLPAVCRPYHFLIWYTSTFFDLSSDTLTSMDFLHPLMYDTN